MGIGVGNTIPLTGSANLSVKVVGVWTSDSNSDNTTPPGIWLVEGSTAGAFYNSNDTSGNTTPTQAGTQDDGWGDPVGTSGDSLGISAPAPNPKYVQAPAGSFTVSLSLKADASTSPAAFWTGGSPGQGQYNPGHCSLSVSVGPVTVAVHAQPYNFRRAYFPGETTSVHVGAGSLQFLYKWSSTDGSFADLSGETIHENVVAPSSPAFYYQGQIYFEPDRPPFNWTPLVTQDIVAVTASSTNGITDTNKFGGLGQTISDAFVTPYNASSFDSKQTFKFHDPATMVTGAEITIPGNSGPFTITDAVSTDPQSPSSYSFKVSKDSVTSLPINLP